MLISSTLPTNPDDYFKIKKIDEFTYDFKSDFIYTVSKYILLEQNEIVSHIFPNFIAFGFQ